MPTHKSEDYKLSAVEYYLTEDKTQEEVCKIFKCSARSLLRWVDKYNENGEIKRHNRKPVAYKVHKDQVKFILDEIKKNKTITMQDLLEKLKEKYPTVTLTSIAPAVHPGRQWIFPSFYFCITNAVKIKL